MILCLYYSEKIFVFLDRDSLLASLVDGVRASGNMDVHVRMTPTPQGKRLGTLGVAVEEEVESMHLKFLQQPPIGMTFAEAVQRFNANVSYSGLLHSVTADVRTCIVDRSQIYFFNIKSVF